MENDKIILDCLLINPPFFFPKGIYYGQRTIDVPLGLTALAAYVREHGFSVQIVDCNYYFKDTDLEFELWFIKNYVEKFSSIKVIGVTTTTPTINVSYRLAALCKRYYPDTVFVLGGAHASFVPDEALSNESVDCVAMGEGEDTLLELLQGQPFENINGLAYKKNTNGVVEFIRNKSRSRNKALDDLPMPAYDLIDINSYRPIIGNFKRLPAMMIVTSRGCPWSCSFCRRTVGKMWTYRSAESLYNEFKYLNEKYGVKDVAIMDDVFTVSKQRVTDFCNLLIEKPLDVQWQCFARVDIVDEEMLLLMKKAGCWGIMYGVENFDQKILDNIQKGVEVEKVFNAMLWTKKAKLESRVCMIVGNEGDTHEVVNDNIRLLKKLDPDLISVSILTPFPGNDVFNKTIREDKILTYDWDKYYGSTPIINIDSLSTEDVEKLYRKMTFSFYLRPTYILKRLYNTRSFHEVKLNFIGGIGILGFYSEKLLRFFKPKKIKQGSDNFTFMQKLKSEYDPVKNKEKIISLTLTATKQTAIS